MNFLLTITFGSLGYFCQAVSIAMLLAAMNRAGWVTGVPIYVALELYIRLYKPKSADKPKRPFGLPSLSQFSHWSLLKKIAHFAKKHQSGKRS